VLLQADWQIRAVMVRVDPRLRGTVIAGCKDSAEPPIEAFGNGPMAMARWRWPEPPHAVMAWSSRIGANLR